MNNRKFFILEWNPIDGVSTEYNICSMDDKVIVARCWDENVAKGMLEKLIEMHP